MEEVQRNDKGRISQGQSGNPRGRPPKALKQLETPADLWEVIKKEANRPTLIKVDGKEVVVTRYEANIRALANGGGGTRLGIKDFLDIAGHAFEMSERVGRRKTARNAFGVAPSSEGGK